MAPTSLMDLSFDELPDPKRVWIGEPGSHEEGLGRLVLLTQDRVQKAAASQILTGRRVNLGWDLTKLEHPAFGRKPFQHEIISTFEGVCFDDIYTMNPQQSSQWDGLRHFGMRASSGSDERIFYGGTTKAEIMDKDNHRIGIQHWAQEGITGRGVLIDYASWAEKKGIEYSAFTQHVIKLQDMQQIAKECNIIFEKGDILLVRVGMTKEWDQKMDADAKKAHAASTKPQHAGVEATLDVLRWIWDSGFAALAGDATSWEVWPAVSQDLILHEYLIPGWGMPIGELFDLEKLAETCKELNRWTFFVSSMPFNMPGGVSSPPNAQAIF
ncbi:uncharacterized protein BCR38DRAFT_490610 [Pseudomassariella vexata]|uniref:Cyclase-domain-containing protein n=1 Tax=Pseudomassariella vexata TaxID=1141098 RepID=A0A1Y2DAL2_9PEZI|nr:uncharacterized protein BCR38DRAFT_490610 [Pseudomassariella vexata]ORY56311.1 hypothetical protein BCR38DRAFT_490610 [Pseudomassariella vexata]